MDMPYNISSCSVFVLLEEDSTLYMRPAAMLTKLANQFEAEVVLEYEKERADGKSLMEIISLGICTGGGFTVFSSGKDALKAIQAVKDFFKGFFLDGKLIGMSVGENAKHAKRMNINMVKKGEMEMKLKKKAALKEDKRKVKTFTWPLGEKVNEVCLAGDFNDWKPEPMAKCESGFHRIVKLEPGVYQYKFVVDGEWLADPSAKESAKNDFGSTNSVLLVK